MLFKEVRLQICQEMHVNRNLHIILKEEEKKQYDKVISTYICTLALELDCIRPFFFYRIAEI